MLQIRCFDLWLALEGRRVENILVTVTMAIELDLILRDGAVVPVSSSPAVALSHTIGIVIPVHWLGSPLVYHALCDMRAYSNFRLGVGYPRGLEPHRLAGS
jgi:hypothetical protein